MSEYDHSIDWRDFNTLDDYIDHRLHEGMEGHSYDYSSRTMVDWAEIFIDQRMWGGYGNDPGLQEWMGWSDDEMSDFFDWWREMYENA